MIASLNPICEACAQRSGRILCGMREEDLAAFDAIQQRSRMEKGERLFSEGHAARGVYLLCEGRARLSICSENGKRLMLRIASPGEILGVGAALSDGVHEVTAELLEPSSVAFIASKPLLKFLREHHAVCSSVVEMLSQDLHAAYQRVRSMGLSRARRARATQEKNRNEED